MKTFHLDSSFSNGLGNRILTNNEITEGGSYLLKQLTQTLPQVYMQDYQYTWTIANLREQMQAGYVPLTGGISGSTQKLESYFIESYGEAVEIPAEAGDIPTVTTSIDNDEHAVFLYGVKTKMGWQEEMVDSDNILPMEGKSRFDTMAAEISLRQRVHKTLCYGSPNRNVGGLFNDPNITPVSSGAYNPNTATYQEHVDFFVDTCLDLMGANRQKRGVEYIFVPLKVWGKLIQTKNSGTDTTARQAIIDDLNQSKDTPMGRGVGLKDILPCTECEASLLEENNVRPASTNEDRYLFLPPINSDPLQPVMQRLGNPMGFVAPQFNMDKMCYETLFYVQTSETIIHLPHYIRYVDAPRVV